MKMINHNHFICHLILGTFTEYPKATSNRKDEVAFLLYIKLFSSITLSFY